MMKNWATAGALSICLSIATGAFASHVLKNNLDAYSLSIFEKACFYQLTQSMGVLLIVLLHSQRFISEKHTRLVLRLMALGIIVFSGSLYALALSGVKVLGAITPIGGTALILAWLVCSIGIYRHSETP